jgi:UDP-N-acetyl-D-mannosaminuronate dehydrogenase
MKHLIVGFGDVGRGLYEIFQENKLEVVAVDKDTDLEGKFDVLHICFPYSALFIDYVVDYISKYQPKLVIIHSTVPPGTTEQIPFAKTIHSPVRGRHPSMARDMKTYTKYFGGKNAEEAEKIFSSMGIKTKSFPNSKTTELGKLLCNIRWGLNIAFAQEQKRMCEYYGVKYEDVVNEFEKSRNMGAKEIGRDNALMPILYPGFIGGHCVMPNVNILMQEYPSIFLKVIQESNEKYGEKL